MDRKFIEIVNDTVFNVTLEGNKKHNNDRKFSKWVNKDSLAFYAKYWRDFTVTVNEATDTNFKDEELYLTDTTNRRCYKSCSYKLYTYKEFSDDDFDKLRALNLFLKGQEEGVVKAHDIQHSISENKLRHVYILGSVCDSSD